MAKLDLNGIKKEREKLAARLAELDDAEAAERARMATIAGEAVLAEADSNEAFRVTLTGILAARVKKNADRSLFDLPKRTRKQAPSSDTPPTAPHATPHA